MTAPVLPTLDDVMTQVRAFVLDVVPPGIEVVQGIDNGVPMPAAGYVLMTAIFQLRLRTNQNSYDDPASPGVGAEYLEQGTRLDVQLDCYGPASAGWATALSTLLRDERGCEALAPVCAPLYADDPRMMPLVTGEERYLQRWAVTAVLQVNFVTTLSQQFADTLAVDIINVDERYPP